MCFFSHNNNLYRESTLKPREQIACLNKIVTVEESISLLQVLIEVDHPDSDIYSAEGTLILEEKKYNFNIYNILLRVS